MSHRTWSALLFSLAACVVWGLCGCSGDGTEADLLEDAGGEAGPDADADADADAGFQGDAGALPPLPTGIYELTGLDPALSTTDLQPLKAILGETPVVGLGESVHTSEGYYAAKHRLFRFLVEEMGFRAFAIESPWTDAELVGDYVATGAGDAYTAVTTGLFSVWASQSMLDMVEWMRAWNVEHPDDPLSYFGFDIQQPWDDGPQLAQYLSLVASPSDAGPEFDFSMCDGVNAADVFDYYDQLNDSNGDGYNDISEGEFNECLSALDVAETFLEENRDVLIALTSAEAFDLALINVIGLRAWEQKTYYISNNMVLSYESRDEGMAYVLSKFREMYHSGEKIAVWAHNWHLAKSTDEITIGPHPPAKSMGTFLSERFGDLYQPIGLVGYSVSINWAGVSTGEMPLPTGDDTVEVMLHALERPYLLVDLAFPGAEETFLATETFYELNGQQMVPADQYRALVFLDESPGMDALLW